jgi:transposase-like protein
MRRKTRCPFCNSSACVIEQRLEKLVEYSCRDCDKKWFAVEGPETTKQIPRFSPVSILPECPHCLQRTQIRVERTVMGGVVRETYICSHCGGALRRDGGKTSA